MFCHLEAAQLGVSDMDMATLLAHIAHGVNKGQGTAILAPIYQNCYEFVLSGYYDFKNVLESKTGAKQLATNMSSISKKRCVH